MSEYLSGYKPTQLTPRQLKKRLDESNVRMAQLLGVSIDTWLAWLSGRRKPSAAALRLMDILVWLFEEGNLPHYWHDFAEPRILRKYSRESRAPAHTFHQAPSE